MNGDMAPDDSPIRRVRCHEISKCCWIEPRSSACVPAHFGSVSEIPLVSALGWLMVWEGSQSLWEDAIVDQIRPAWDNSWTTAAILLRVEGVGAPYAA